MTIYIEQTLIENFIIDFLILKLSLKILKLNTKKYKLFISCLIGAFAAIISPMLYSYLSVLLKIVLGFIMVIIIAPKINLKRVFLLYLSFLSITFLFGGACYFLENTISSYVGKKFENIPIFLILIMCIFMFFVCCKLIKKIYIRKASVQFEYEIILQSEFASVKALAFLDSGNKLQDNFSPVILIDALTFIKLYPSSSLSDVILKKTNNLCMKNTHILSVSSINNSKYNLIVFSLPKLKVDSKEFNNISCAISLKKFKFESNISCLLNPLLF